MTDDYYVAGAYFRLMMQGDQMAADLVTKTLGTQLAIATESEFVPGRLINQTFEAFATHGFDSWITRYGSLIGVGSHGPLGFAALSAPDLGTALAILTDFMVIRTSAFEAEIHTRQNRLEIGLKDRTRHDLAGRWLIESGYLVVQGLIETITLHHLGDSSELTFAYPKLSSHQQLENLFKLPCSYDSTENMMSIPASWAGIPSPLSDPDTFRSNTAKCREIKLSLDRDKSDVLRLVNIRLFNHFERRLSNQTRSEKIPSLNLLADELCMSPRTLIRKLEKQASSYKKILAQVRLQQANRLLKNTHFTAAEIADKLGYQEPANFSRAFRRWTGQTPASWRRNT